MNKELYQKLRDKIISAVPEIMELKEGCIINYKQAEKNIGVRNGKYTMIGKINGAVITFCEDDEGVRIGEFTHLEGDKNIKIIGRDIRLDDVLVALDKTSEKRNYDAWFVGGNGYFYELNIKLEDTDIKWIFNKSLQSQSDETKVFLANLLK